MEENDDPLIVRVGTFFMVLGAGSFLLFVTSDLADQVDFDYLFGAMLLLAIGWYFRRKKAPPPASGRFAGLKNLLSKRKKGGQEKKESK
ncbi:MAG: hypothetical protein DPW18_06250 [Chloroflexi bacterium]|nr:hypothetical protein [Chloroflexota bacterium]MDL1941875.1 hypothetical protein [Chloroflexi bacterium CFX2]